MKSKTFCIRDWSGDLIENGFASFDEAEEYLNELLGEDYDMDREEYNIEEN